MKWEKLGLLYCPAENNRHPKLLTHAANPLPVFLNGDVYRIFYSGRDAQNRSSVGAVDIDILKQEIVHEYQNPFFQHGPNDSFYADGVSIGNCYDVGDKKYMLFMGWQSSLDKHWRGDIGRLIVSSELTLSLDSIEPFLGSNNLDPISLSYPWVDNHNNGYRMWYGSTLTWDGGNGEMIHVINFATSPDGHNWHRKGLGVPYQIGKAQAFSRPTVIGNEQLGFEMWFSYRSGCGKKYRIGYADSSDGEQWMLNLEKAGIDVSPDGWDSEMIEYPFVFDHNDKRFMLYNGNGYGKTGFGFAVQK